MRNVEAKELRGLTPFSAFYKQPDFWQTRTASNVASWVACSSTLVVYAGSFKENLIVVPSDQLRQSGAWSDAAVETNLARRFEKHMEAKRLSSLANGRTIARSLGEPHPDDARRGKSPAAGEVGNVAKAEAERRDDGLPATLCSRCLRAGRTGLAFRSGTY